MKSLLNLLNGSPKWERNILPGVRKLSEQDFFPGITGYYHPIDGVSPVLTLNASLWVGALVIVSIIDEPRQLQGKDATSIYNKLFSATVPLLEQAASFHAFHNGKLWKLFMVPKAASIKEGYNTPHIPIEEALSYNAGHSSASKGPSNRYSMRDAEDYVRKLTASGLSTGLIRAIGQTTMEISSKLVGVPEVQRLFVAGTIALLLNHTSHFGGNEFEVSARRQDGGVSLFYGMIEGITANLEPEKDDIEIVVISNRNDTQEKTNEVMRYLNDDTYLLVSKENSIMRRGDIPKQTYRFRKKKDDDVLLDVKV